MTPEVTKWAAGLGLLCSVFTVACSKSPPRLDESGHANLSKQCEGHVDGIVAANGGVLNELIKAGQSIVRDTVAGPRMGPCAGQLILPMLERESVKRGYGGGPVPIK